jgi:hypothetical protein
MLSQIVKTETGWNMRGSSEWANDSAFTLLNTLVPKGHEDDRDLLVDKNRHGKRAKWEARISQADLTLQHRGGFL